MCVCVRERSSLDEMAENQGVTGSFVEFNASFLRSKRGLLKITELVRIKLVFISTHTHNVCDIRVYNSFMYIMGRVGLNQIHKALIMCLLFCYNRKVYYTIPHGLCCGRVVRPVVTDVTAAINSLSCHKLRLKQLGHED